MLVLVVVLVLDVFGLCGEKGIRSVMILFDRSDGETSAFSSTSTKGQPQTSCTDQELWAEWHLITKCHSALSLA